jgi:hypothetical protein
MLRVPHPCAFFAQGWELQTPAAPAFDFDLASNLPANREEHDVQSCRKAGTTVEERRLSAA